MTEKVLPYNRGIVPQETGYWCGPAATQVVLNSRGVDESEAVLARELGTHTGGTDHIGLVLPALNRRLPDAKYVTVVIPNDPPTAAQRDALWANIVGSINAGYGLVMNWVAPPGNYPRGVKGSASPRYGGGTVYHYVAAMGYDDVERAVWIADSGFQPQGYWVSLEQCASLIPPKGYAYASAAAKPGDGTTSPQPPAAADVLSRAMGARLSLDRYRELLPAVAASLEACECGTVERIAMWVAQIGHESGGLFYTEEIASGDAYEGRADLGNTQAGDGPRFKGRSWIQITGRANYTALSHWAHAGGLAPTPTFFVDNPAALAADQYAGLGAAWYWVVARPDIGVLADRRDLETVTRRINGGLNGIEDRRTRYQRALAMGDQLLTLTTGGDDDLSAEAERMIHDVHDALFTSVPSQSIYATPGEGARWELHELIRNGDGMLHALYVEQAARLGDFAELARVALVATGRGVNTDTNVVARARNLLAEIEANTPELLKAFLAQNGADR